MAVKPEQITVRLKVKYPKANLSKERMTELSGRLAKLPADDADDAAIDLVLDQYNDFIPFEDIARQDDKIRTLEAKKPAEPTPPNPTDPKDLTDPKPDPLKAVLDAIGKLSGDVEAIKTGKITDTKKQTVSQLFEKSDVLKNLPAEIKQSWINRVNVTTETTEDEIAEQIKGFETEHTALTQHVADTAGYSPAPPQGSGDIKFSAEEAEKIVSNIL